MIWLILLLVMSYSCALGGDSLAVRKQAIQLNNRAMALMQNAYDDTATVKKALQLFNEACALDNKSALILFNKTNALCRLHRPLEALTTLELLLRNHPTYVQAVSLRGIMFESIGKTDSATVQYKKALRIYDRKHGNKQSSTQQKIDRAFLLFFAQDKQAANAALENALASDPDFGQSEFWRQTFKSFDKAQYINQVCP